MANIALNIVALSSSTTSVGNYVIILEEINGERRLPIIIGEYEAKSIAVSLENMKPNRPVTHDLFKNTMDACAIQLLNVTIPKLEEGIFYAILTIEKDDKSLIKIDSRASDALALAVRFGSPIFTTEDIMHRAGVLLKSPSKAFSNKRGQLSDYSLEELEKMLEKVLSKEDYESATRLRDAIKNKKQTN